MENKTPQPLSGAAQPAKCTACSCPNGSCAVCGEHICQDDGYGNRIPYQHSCKGISPAAPVAVPAEPRQADFLASVKRVVLKLRHARSMDDVGRAEEMLSDAITTTEAQHRCDVCKQIPCACEISEDDYEYGEPERPFDEQAAKAFKERKND